MAGEAIFYAPRHSRLEIEPSDERGVYGLFLLPEASLGWLDPGPEGLIYVGKAEGVEGFAQRCHFVGRTVNHSPRKSLAVLLKDSLGLDLRGHPGDKWGLTPQSERQMSNWMFANLRVAFLPTATPTEDEKQLVLALVPPLNLNICEQGPQHRRISQLRKEAKAFVQANGAIGISMREPRTLQVSASKTLNSIGRMEGAPAIADHFGLDPKQYRAALRKRHFAWHEHWGSWDVPHGSNEWQDMIAVAEEISGRR